jgi:hydroxylamine reductase
MLSCSRLLHVCSMIPDVATSSRLSLSRPVNTALQGMALLDKANTTAYGNPEVTTVDLGVRKNPGILISGHDLRDLEMLLEQTEGTGVDVYTHGEMLPAHYYPKFKQYKNFAGNYGNAWWKQKEEFEASMAPFF